MPETYVQKFFEMLEQNLGILLDSSKEYLVRSKLISVIDGTQHQNVRSFIEELSRTKVGPLHWIAFEALTTNETSFFRDKHVFDGIKDVVLPKLIEARKNSKSLRFWSLASSSGQEAYSIAMLIRDSFPELSDWSISIQGTDISRLMLEKAKSGIYSAHELSRGLNTHFIQKYFKEVDKGSFQINQMIRDVVSFVPHNLVHDWPQFPMFDLILLRNVLIYFSEERRSLVLEKSYQHLDPNDGVLILGSSESTAPSRLYKQVSMGEASYFKPIYLQL
jgi:chemotaxis protein methyltransferase CheR